MQRRDWLIQAVLAGSGLATAHAAGVGKGAGTTIRVLAASDLKFALAQVMKPFEQETGHRVELSFGSSGNFARQIQQGLPADLFMSADEGFVLQLADAGLTRMILSLGGPVPDRGALYAQGRIALYVPANSRIPLDAGLLGLKAQWSSVGKFSIANPEHAPYGRAAREALQSLGLWEMVQTKLVLGENIAQATQFVSTGAAQAGITALALALAPELARVGHHVVLPDTLHAPLRQRMVLLKAASGPAVALYAYLQRPASRQAMHALGFAS